METQQTQRNHMTIAKTIWSQIDLATKMACGARQPVGDRNSLTFGVKIVMNRIDRIKVTLDASDTYTITFYRVYGASRNYEHEARKTVSCVYCDSLSSVIYDLCHK